jgi:hypothetical protein
MQPEEDFRYGHHSRQIWRIWRQTTATLRLEWQMLGA